MVGDAIKMVGGSTKMGGEDTVPLFNRQLTRLVYRSIDGWHSVRIEISAKINVRPWTLDDLPVGEGRLRGGGGGWALGTWSVWEMERLPPRVEYASRGITCSARKQSIEGGSVES